MKAMILAAGRGERMRPLTDHTPKPLLQVGQHALIEWHLLKMAAAGITDIVINVAWLGERIQAHLQDGSRYGVSIRYSPEANALETAGGIKNALPLLGDEPFLIINGDVYTDWTPQLNSTIAASLTTQQVLAHVYLVDNPPHHPQGDFYYCPNSTLLLEAPPSVSSQAYTYSGIGYYHPEFFHSVEQGSAAPLGPLLREHIHHQQVSACLHTGQWVDVGTPERLQALNQQLGENS